MRCEQHFESASTAEESWQPRHRAAAGNQAGTHLPLRNEGLFTARKAHVAGESEFAANACSAPANQGNRDNRRAADTHEHVRQGLQAGAAERKLRRLFRFREEVIVDKKESVDRAVKNHDFDAFIRFDQGNDFFQLRNVGWTENVQRRKIKRDLPIFRRYPLQTNFSCNRCCTHLRLLF